MYIDGSNPETDHNLYTLDKNQPLLTDFNVSKAKSVLFYPRLKKNRTKQQKPEKKESIYNTKLHWKYLTGSKY